MASQVVGLEGIVHSCIEEVGRAKDFPEAVTRRLIRLGDALASGELSPTSRSELYKRLELVILGFDAAE